MATQISQLVVRQDTAVNWIDGGWLDKGELGYDETHHILKIGTANRQPWGDALTINDNVTLESLGITATAEEINILHGVVISSTILNYLQGVRSNVQEQIDSKSSNTHVHDVEISGTAKATNSYTSVASSTHTHEYTRVSGVEEHGVHSHTVNVPTQKIEQDASGNYILAFGMQLVNVNEAGAHTHNILTETLTTTAPNETTDVASKEHTHEVTGTGSTGQPR